ncbi:MAG TPA: DUF3574 domain-containing protein [Longimicrobiales bacterium]|nr:DUF3574 domain-containing protein [Longimicrobiales bacterium]
MRTYRGFSQRLLTATTLMLLAVVLAGCDLATATIPQDGNPQSAEEWVGDRFYFGRDMGGGEVSEEAWRQFLEEVVTPRFPDGLTVWSADGQWRNSEGVIIRERTFILEIYHPGEPAAETAFNAIVAEYRNRFQQAAVLRVSSPATVRFYQ